LVSLVIQYNDYFVTFGKQLLHNGVEIDHRADAIKVAGSEALVTKVCEFS